MTACIYLVKATNSDGLHIIGKTINLSRRMCELKVLPEDQVLVIELPDESVMHRVERILHDCFDDVRVPQSEMFNLTPAMLQACIEKMQAFQNEHAVSMAKLAEWIEEEERLERERWFTRMELERERKRQVSKRRHDEWVANALTEIEAEIAMRRELQRQLEEEKAERKLRNRERIKKQLKRLIPSWLELLLFLASAWLFGLTGQDILLNSFLIACVWVTLKWAARKIQKGPDIRS